MPPEDPQSPVQRMEDFVDVLPLERIQGLFCGCAASGAQTRAFLWMCCLWSAYKGFFVYGG